MCHEGNTTIKGKTKREQTKKHKYFSNLVLNKYVTKDIVVDKFKDAITPYYIEHIKKFNILTVYVYFKVDDEIKYKISVTNQASYAITVHGCSLIINETACDFLNKVITNYLDHEELPIKIQKTAIVFISDLKDMTFSHYMDQSKSMFCRKMIRRFFEVKGEDIIDFEYNWIPGCLCVNGVV